MEGGDRIWDDRPLVVTGASGALGRVLVTEALRRGARVAAIVRR